MPLLQRTGGMGAKGFGLTSVNTFSFIATLSSNTSSYNLATQATSAGWNGVAPLIVFLTINSGVSLSGTGNTTSSALILPSSIPTKSIITLTNNGSIYGAGGAGGRNNAGGYYQENGNTDGIGEGGDVPNNPYGTNGSSVAGSNASNGYTAIYMDTNCIFKIYNYGTITGGGGGAGGNGGNNSGGGSGGNGGIALVETGTPTVTLYNQTGATFGGGGGGGAGWGNRDYGQTAGGAIGQNGYTVASDGAAVFGSNGTAGRSSTNNSTTVFSGAGTYSL